MKTQTIVILSVGVALCVGCLICGGLVASYLTSQLIAAKNRKVVILVAKHDYAKGTAITVPEDMFEPREILEADAPPGAISELKDLWGLTLIEEIREGQPVSFTLVERTNKGARNALMRDPEPGKRIIEIKISGRWGFVRAGDRVDVIYSKSDGDSKPEGKILMQDILVRAVERQMANERDTLELVPLIVTLEVTPEQALVLVPIRDKGSIALVVRPAGGGNKPSANKSKEKP